MKDFLRNLGSKKFLIALVSIIAGILTLMNCDENLIQFICSIVMIVVPAITYVIIEGVLDYTSIRTSMNDLLDVIDKYLQTRKDKEENSQNNVNNSDNTELSETEKEHSEQKDEVKV